MGRAIWIGLALGLTGCGEKPLLVHYTVNIHIAVADWVTAADTPTLDVPPCANAEVFDETLRVYSGNDPAAVAAVSLVWDGFDLSGGGENTETYMLSPGDRLPVYAALDPTLRLYEFDHRGRMQQIDKDVAKVSGKSESNLSYELGEGLPVVEDHVLSDDEVDVWFIEEAPLNCDLTGT